MKILLALVCLALAIPLTPGCPTVPSSARVANVEVQSLKAIGQTAELLLETSAKLYRDKQITAAQAREVNAFYLNKFQPAFNAAKNAVLGTLGSMDSNAPVDVVTLFTQFSALVNNLKKTP